MKHTVYISAAPNKAGGWLHLDRIKYKGKEYTVTKDQKVCERSLMKAGDQPLNIHITPDHKYTFSFDDDSAIKNNESNEGRKLMAEIIPYHQQMITDGFKNPNSGTALLYQFEDIAMNDNRNFKVLAMIRSVMNKGWDMSFREKYDAMYYYGGNPAGMGHKQVTIQLIDGTFGILMRRTAFGNSGKTFMEHFVEDYKSSDPTAILKTNILKALLLIGADRTPILRRDGSAILFGDKVLGSNIEECVVWLNNNPNIRDHIEQMVSQSDNLDADDLDQAIHKMQKGEDAPEKVLEKKATLKELQDKGKKLLVDYYWKKSPQDLVVEIEKAEKVWDEVNLMNLQGDVDKIKEKTLLKIKDLIERKKKEADYLADNVIKKAEPEIIVPDKKTEPKLTTKQIIKKNIEAKKTQAEQVA